MQGLRGQAGISGALPKPTIPAAQDRPGLDQAARASPASQFAVASNGTVLASPARTPFLNNDLTGRMTHSNLELQDTYEQRRSEAHERLATTASKAR